MSEQYPTASQRQINVNAGISKANHCVSGDVVCLFAHNHFIILLLIWKTNHGWRKQVWLNAAQVKLIGAGQGYTDRKQQQPHWEELQNKTGREPRSLPGCFSADVGVFLFTGDVTTRSRVKSRRGAVDELLQQNLFVSLWSSHSLRCVTHHTGLIPTLTINLLPRRPPELQQHLLLLSNWPTKRGKYYETNLRLHRLTKTLLWKRAQHVCEPRLFFLWQTQLSLRVCWKIRRKHPVRSRPLFYQSLSLSHHPANIQHEATERGLSSSERFSGGGMAAWMLVYIRGL